MREGIICLKIVKYKETWSHRRRLKKLRAITTRAGIQYGKVLILFYAKKRKTLFERWCDNIRISTIVIF